MTSTLGVPEVMREKVKVLIEAQKIPLTVVAADTGDINVVESAKRQESSLSLLYAGGWIACHIALALAQKLNIGGKDMGKLLNDFEIKIRDCSLGCFK